ncbi:MAG: S41 family peptidase [Planctomycetota bacterium]
MPLTRSNPFFALTLLALGLFAASCAQVPGSGTEGAVSESRLTAESLQAQVNSFDQVWQTVRDRHWDPELGGVDWEAARKELRPEVLRVHSQSEARRVMNELLGRLGQSHFNVFKGKNDHEVFAEGAEPKTTVNPVIPDNSATSIGGDGDPGFDVTWVDGKAFVAALRSGSPASTAGVQVGWELIEARGVDLKERVEKLDSHSDHPSDLLINSVLAAAIGGQPGALSPFRFRDRIGHRKDLSIRHLPPRGEPFELTEDAVLRIWWSKRQLSNGVGYIAFNAFGAPDKLVNFISESMTEFQDAPGIVLDVRGNPGGIGSLASTIAGYFVDETGRNMGKMQHRSGEITFPVFPRAKVYDGPLALLIDGASGSTAEIFAAGLKDLGRARLFGTTTAGAVLPAQIVTLPNGDGFIFATADFVSPNGRRLEGVGAEPDEKVEHSRASLVAGRDAILNAAANWLTSDAARQDGDRRRRELTLREAARVAKSASDARANASRATLKPKEPAASAAAAALPTGESLMERYLQATGGAVAYRKIQSLSITAEIYLGQMLGKKPIVSQISTAGDDGKVRYHSVLDLGSFGKINEGSDGVTVWESSAIMGNRIVEGSERATKLRSANPLALADWRRHFRSVETVAEEQVAGKDCWKLTVTPIDEDPEIWWIDQATDLLLRSQTTSDSPMGRITLTADNEDYRSVDGILIPHRVKVSGGPEAQVIELKAFEVNPVFESSVFELPQVIKDLRAKAKSEQPLKKGA